MSEEIKKLKNDLKNSNWCMGFFAVLFTIAIVTLFYTFIKYENTCIKYENTCYELDRLRSDACYWGVAEWKTIEVGNGKNKFVWKEDDLNKLWIEKIILPDPPVKTLTE